MGEVCEIVVNGKMSLRRRRRFKTEGPFASSGFLFEIQGEFHAKGRAESWRAAYIDRSAMDLHNVLYN